MTLHCCRVQGAAGGSHPNALPTGMALGELLQDQVPRGCKLKVAGFVPRQMTATSSSLDRRMLCKPEPWLFLQVPPIPRTHDEGNPDMESEFFDTRQVQSVDMLTWSVAPLPTLFNVYGETLLWSAPCKAEAMRMQHTWTMSACLELVLLSPCRRSCRCVRGTTTSSTPCAAPSTAA